jgi:hydrogenase-4 component B
MVFASVTVALGLAASLTTSYRKLSQYLMLGLSAELLAWAFVALMTGHGTQILSPWFLLTPLRAWFLLVVGLVSVLASWYRLGYHQHHWRFTAVWLPWFVMAMATVTVAQNVWVFMTAWEIMAITSFLLVVTDHQAPGVTKAGYVYLVMSQFSAMAILAGLLLMAASLHSANFAVWARHAHALPPNLKGAIFLLLTLGFAIKSGLIPFHVWLPRAHPIAPTPVSSLMSGAMIKMGIFGVVQFLLQDLGATSVIWSVMLLVLGAISSLLGVLYALMEHDLKRLLAYHSIENVGIIFLGLGVMGVGLDTHRPWLTEIGLVAALFHTLNHALFKSQLFFAAGAVQQHTGTLDAEHLGGLIRQIPGVALGFLLGAMAISALPPFNGFVSEWLTFRGILALSGALRGLWALGALSLALVLATTSALAGLCFVKASGVVFLGQPRKPVASSPISSSLVVPMFVMAGLSLALGIFPQPVVHLLAAFQPHVPTAFAPVLPLNTGEIALLLALFTGVSVLVARVGTVRVVPRWACGGNVEPTMQFSSAAMTKAIRTTFAVIYRPHRQLVRVGEHARDFPDRLIYRAGTTPTWERYLYWPSYRFAWWLSRVTSRIQRGPVRLYLTYLLVTVGVMLLLIR